MLSLLLLAPLALAAGHDNLIRRQTHKARMATPEAELEKRQDGTFGGRATFFDVGLGACGQYNVASDFIVALNTPQYGGGSPGPECFKMITITYNGNTQQAQIMDECPSCNYGDLDMSRGLFDSFASEDLGEFQMTWWYNDAAPPPSQPTTSTQDPPTSTWQPPPTTSQWQPPSTTSTSTTPTPTPTSTSTSTSQTTSSSTSSTSSSSSSSGTDSLNGTPTTLSTAPNATPSPGNSINNENDLNQLVVALGNIIAKAPASN
ncbi:hypothetical protein DACRYDRAFT_20399 [Dacryopinax primogenitus]|uniref:RlpA-like protein double-psi beta-barrel domain-containing protein n=1 Tax=Dacryopinax primogenitus (strain DJM 731) TaxID=1858805 RepID=M5G996_DACPD|nr:uncharacterized protein DACRYDRAFT_20399 [Dacryopinax primogenitus]EJU04775.1 hypothetical protein DACRYDRAFT_20399 [Dacryopinax primogenitus]